MVDLNKLHSFMTRAMKALQQAKDNGDVEGVERNAALLKRSHALAEKGIQQAQSQQTPLMAPDEPPAEAPMPPASSPTAPGMRPTAPFSPDRAPAPQPQRSMPSLSSPPLFPPQVNAAPAPVAEPLPLPPVTPEPMPTPDGKDPLAGILGAPLPPNTPAYPSPQPSGPLMDAWKSTLPKDTPNTGNGSFQLLPALEAAATALVPPLAYAKVGKWALDKIPGKEMVNAGSEFLGAGKVFENTAPPTVKNIAGEVPKPPPIETQGSSAAEPVGPPPDLSGDIKHPMGLLDNVSKSVADEDEAAAIEAIKKRAGEEPEWLTLENLIVMLMMGAPATMQKVMGEKRDYKRLVQDIYSDTISRRERGRDREDDKRYRDSDLIIKQAKLELDEDEAAYREEKDELDAEDRNARALVGQQMPDKEDADYQSAKKQLVKSRQEKREEAARKRKEAQVRKNNGLDN